MFQHVTLRIKANSHGAITNPRNCFVIAPTHSHVTHTSKGLPKTHFLHLVSTPLTGLFLRPSLSGLHHEISARLHQAALRTVSSHRSTHRLVRPAHHHSLQKR